MDSGVPQGIRPPSRAKLPYQRVEIDSKFLFSGPSQFGVKAPYVFSLDTVETPPLNRRPSLPPGFSMGFSITAKSSEGVGGASLAVRAWFIVSDRSIIYRGGL